MNYFEHHIGDYAQATAHLTFAEDAAYHRLLRKIYADEKPLPDDVKAVQRLVAARTKEERQAVVDVLNEFFVLQADGWHQARADREISRYQEKQAKARASANARWKDANASKKDTEPVCEGNANASETHDGRNAHQTPDTNHQPPEDKTRSPAEPAFVLPDWVPVDEWRAWMPIRAAKKAKNTPYALGLIVKDLDRWRQAGHSVAAILQTSIRGGWSDVYEPKAALGGRQPFAANRNDRTAAARTMFGTTEPEVIDV